MNPILYDMTSKDKPYPTWAVVIRHYVRRTGPLSWFLVILLLVVLYLLYKQMVTYPARIDPNSQTLKDHRDPDLADEELDGEEDEGEEEGEEDEDEDEMDDEGDEEHGEEGENGHEDPEHQDKKKVDTRKGGKEKVIRIAEEDIQKLDAAGVRVEEISDKGKKVVHDNVAKVVERKPKKFNVHNHDLDEVDEDYILAQQHNKDPNAMPVIPRFDPNRHIHGALPEGEVFYPSPKIFPVGQMLTPQVDHCPTDTSFVIIIVVTTANQTRHRSSIRRTWGNPSNFQKVALRSKMSWWVVFSIGSMEGSDEKIREEEQTHGDIIQGDFADHPAEETRKTLQALRWVSEHLPSTCRPLFLLKTECSVFVNTPLLTHWIGEHYKQSLATYAGKVIRDDVPIRDLRSSLHVSKEDYPREAFPPFIQGPSFLVSMDVVTAMASMVRQVTPIAMEDAYIGLLANRLKQVPENVDKFQLTARPQNLCHYLEMLFIKTGKATVHHQIFRVVNHQEEKCTRPNDL